MPEAPKELTPVTITVDGTQYVFDVDDLTNREAMAIEKVTGSTLGAFMDALKEGSATALTALVWVILRRETPSIRFDDVEFKFADIEGGDEVEAEGPDPTEPVSE